MKYETVCRIPGRSGRFEVRYENGVLTQLKPHANGSDTEPQFWLSPGLFDIQVNGMLGHNLSSDQLTIENVVEIDEGLAEHGVTCWCPTITTESAELVERNLKIITAAVESGGVPGVHCVHLEGHYISAEPGFRGVHMPRYIRDPDPEEFSRWQEAAKGRIGLFSLAPNRKGSLEFIKLLRRRGVRPALVHHNAKHQEIVEAVAAGADLSSHLVNGCASMIHRQHNIIWSQLSIDDLWASFIADGYHIPPYTLKAVIRSKSVARSILVSDLSHLSGLPDGEYTKNEQTVVVQNGGLWVKSEGKDLLSGAVKTLDLDCAFVAGEVGFSIEEALQMASTNPARYFQIELSHYLFPGRRGRLVVFSWKNGKLNVEKTLK